MFSNKSLVFLLIVISCFWLTKGHSFPRRLNATIIEHQPSKPNTSMRPVMDPSIIDVPTTCKPGQRVNADRQCQDVLDI